MIKVIVKLKKQYNRMKLYLLKKKIILIILINKFNIKLNKNLIQNNQVI